MVYDVDDVGSGPESIVEVSDSVKTKFPDTTSASTTETPSAPVPSSPSTPSTPSAPAGPVAPVGPVGPAGPCGPSMVIESYETVTG